jgi:hypothetical protein
MVSETAARVKNPPQSRKWIAKRLAELDAERDYAEIVRLSSVYAANDFQMHWFYAVNSPAAGIAPGVLDAVYRGGAGTYTAKPDQRVEDSADHLMTWFEHGPESPVTQASVEMVNGYHAHFARDYPQGFDKIDDYIYILCLNATGVNSSMVSLGLPGYDEKQKRAVHLFWSKLADQFRHVVAGGRVTEHAPFPDSYDGMVAVVDDYFARDWPVYEPGHQLTSSAIEHFVRTWFPRPLHFAGRALVTSFMAPAVLRAHSIKPPAPPVRWVARRVMKAMVLLSVHVLPDAKVPVTDARRAPGSKTHRPSHIDEAVHRTAARSPGGLTGCPHLDLVTTTGKATP